MKNKFDLIVFFVDSFLESLFISVAFFFGLRVGFIVCGYDFHSTSISLKLGFLVGSLIYWFFIFVFVKFIVKAIFKGWDYIQCRITQRKGSAG